MEKFNQKGKVKKSSIKFSAPLRQQTAAKAEAAAAKLGRRTRKRIKNKLIFPFGLLPFFLQVQKKVDCASDSKSRNQLMLPQLVEAIKESEEKNSDREIYSRL